MISKYKIKATTSDLQDHALDELKDIIKNLEAKSFKSDKEMIQWLEKECQELVDGVKDGLDD